MISKNYPVAITFDVDWAPDFAIIECADICKKFSVPATFFVTHPSEVIKELQGERLFEFGIHPNFLKETTHGNNEVEVIKHCLDIVPDACLMRTHGLYSYSNLYRDILENFPQIKIDFSIFLPGNNYCKPFKFYNTKGNNSYIIRVPYQWEDDVYFLESPQKNILVEEASYQVFNFHPIHVCLNSCDSVKYTSMKKNIKSNRLCGISELLDMGAYINNDIGTKTWLLSIMSAVNRNRFIFASDIPDKFL